MSHTYDWERMADELNGLLRLTATPLVMKWYEREEDIRSVPKVRTSDKHFSPCQTMGQASYFNWTVAVLARNIHCDYCRAIHGMFEPDAKFRSGKMFEGVWYGTPEAASAHHTGLNRAPAKYEAIVFAPLASGRIAEPDVCAMYINSAQAFMLLSGLTYTRYAQLDFTFSGESTCSDSWVRAFVSGKPSLSVPCFAERKFGGVRESDLMVAMKPEDLVTAIKGLHALSKNGLRYPIAPYSLSADIMDGLPASYAGY